jgi:tetratricopeptide (TPR) repeat protein
MGIIRPPTRQEPTIRWRGQRLTITAANVLAVQEHRQGHFEAVVEIYNLMLAKAPDYAEGHNNRGAVLQQLKQYDAALASYERALALKPGYANAHYNRATTLKKLGRQEEALAAFDRAIALKPEHAEAYNNRGVLLQELKRYAEALACFDRVIALNPNHAEGHNNRGVILMSLGDMPGAERMFLAASRLKPGFADPLFNLVNIRNYRSAEGAEVAEIRALLDRPGVAPGDREHLYFSLGKILDDCGRYEEAFDCFRQANELRNAGVAYNPEWIRAMTDAIIEVFSKEFLAQPFAHASDSSVPCFIVGMPRSGTTLLASILSNHPAVGAAGELSTLGDLAMRLGEGTPGGAAYPAAVRHLGAAAAAGVINGYEQRLRRDFGPETRPEIRHVIDKNPLNFRHIGLISMLFPRARIIHCARQPLDTCLSNYFQRFPLHLDYCFDLRNIGHFYGQYARLMEHWGAMPQIQMMTVRYEDMVLRTEAAARSALEFLGLEWDARCLTPHTNRYAVETASQWQVRQPIYQRAMERWRHYERHLGPLKEALPKGVYD